MHFAGACLQRSGTHQVRRFDASRAGFKPAPAPSLSARMEPDPVCARTVPFRLESSQVAGSALGRKHGIRGGRDLVIDGDMAHRVIAAFTHAVILPAWLMGGLSATLETASSDDPPPAVAAFHVANNVHLAVRAGRDVDVARPGRRGASLDRLRSAYGRRTFPRPTQPPGDT